MQPPQTLRTCKPISILTLDFAKVCVFIRDVLFPAVHSNQRLDSLERPWCGTSLMSKQRQSAWKGRDVIWDEMKVFKFNLLIILI